MCVCVCVRVCVCDESVCVRVCVCMSVRVDCSFPYFLFFLIYFFINSAVWRGGGSGLTSLRILKLANNLLQDEGWLRVLCVCVRACMRACVCLCVVCVCVFIAEREGGREGE